MLIWADTGYVGQLVDWVKANCGWILEIVKLNGEKTEPYQILLQHMKEYSDTLLAF